MDYNNFIPRLGEEWAPKFKEFIESDKCEKIYKKLKENSNKGVVICPDSPETFRAFKECPYKGLKAVFIAMEPYSNIINGKKAADGLAFSCANTQIAQPSLIKFYDAIEKDVYKGLALDMEKNSDLGYLARQGVLLLNRSLTVREGNIRSHMGLWDEFLTYTLNFLNIENRGLIFVFMGNDAQEYSYLIEDKIHYVFEIEHPSYANRQNRDWKVNGLFSKIDEILKQNNKESILWDLGPAPF